MLVKSRRLLDFRKSIVSMLTRQLGYNYEDVRKRYPLRPDTNGWMYGPRADGAWMVSNLEAINTGEAHYRVDIPATIMELLGRKQTRATHHPELEAPTPWQARMRMSDLLMCGREFEIKRGECGYDRKQGGKQYGVVQYVNWLDPVANQFTVHEGWRGVMNDGVAWDMVISVNHIPLVGVMIAPTTEGHRPCEEAYTLMRRQIDADPRFYTYCQFCIISDGKTTLVGSPDDPAEWFLPWIVSDEEQQAAEVLDIPKRLQPFYALLDKERLLGYLHNFIRLVGEDEDQMLYAAHCHEVHAVKTAAQHLAYGKGAGYAVLDKSDEELRSYPFKTHYETTRRLLHDYLLLTDLLDEAEEGSDASVRFVVEPAMSAEEKAGTCVYRPKGKLRSPLAND